MPTEAPGTFRCKTWYPIWLNGKYNYSLYVCMIISMCLIWEGRGYCHLFTDLKTIYRFLAMEFESYCNRFKFNTCFPSRIMIFHTVVNNARHNYWFSTHYEFRDYLIKFSYSSKKMSFELLQCVDMMMGLVYHYAKTLPCVVH